MMAILKLIIVSITLACAVGCPPAKLVEPCVCWKNELTCQRKDLSLEQATRHLKFSKYVTIFKKLKVKMMQLRTLKLQVLDDIPFGKLEVSNCELDAITDAEVVNMPKLKVIKIAASIDEHKADFKMNLLRLRNLNRIEITDNYIKKVPSDWFGKELAMLKYLILSENQIELLEDKAFHNLLNLEILYLNKNRLTEIKRSVLPPLGNKIKKINLSYNLLEVLPEDMFSDLRSLQTIDLRHNQISHLPQETWKPIWSQITILHLRGNPLNCSVSMEWIARQSGPTLSGRCTAPYERKDMQLITMIKILNYEYTLPPEYIREQAPRPPLLK